MIDDSIPLPFVPLVAAVPPLTTLSRVSTCIAVDWSGSMSAVRSRLWLAESRRERWMRVECGYERSSVIRNLIASAARDPELVVGIDFSFSFPRWFMDEFGAQSAREMWEIVAREGESWLHECPEPFWGKPFMPCPARILGRNALRDTEQAQLLVGGIGPKSIFQIGGAGTVGTGSLRGMPYLRELQDAGFSIWPFDEPRLPMVVEIYPRYLTGRVHKSSAIARALYLQAHHAHESREMLDLAGCSEDAFDAAVSASCMQRFARDFESLARLPRTELDRMEGRIWSPLRDPSFDGW
ncbi:MAG: hypothetical protein SGI72_04845 [Planctomycetota bacterium]|nr:hypothetical protein [Planctomycetota bacterium]